LDSAEKIEERREGTENIQQLARTGRTRPASGPGHGWWRSGTACPAWKPVRAVSPVGKWPPLASGRPSSTLQPSAGAQRRRVAPKKSSARKKASRGARPAGRDHTKMAKVIAPAANGLKGPRLAGHHGARPSWQTHSVRGFHQRPVEKEAGPEGSLLPARRRACLLHQNADLTRSSTVLAPGGNPARRFLLSEPRHPVMLCRLHTIRHLTVGACISLQSIDPTSWAVGIRWSIDERNCGLKLNIYQNLLKINAGYQAGNRRASPLCASTVCSHRNETGSLFSALSKEIKAATNSYLLSAMETR